MLINEKHLEAPNVAFSNWLHKGTQHEYIGYQFTGDMEDAENVVKHFGRFDFQLEHIGMTPNNHFMMLNLESGNLEFYPMKEVFCNFSPVFSNPKPLSPITDFARYINISDGMLVDAINIPRWGGIRRWLEFTDGHRWLDLTPCEMFTACHKNVLFLKRKEHSLTAFPGDWLIRDAHNVFHAMKPTEFEAAYEPIDLDAADFSDALMWLKEGKRIARKGWNAKGQFCWLVPEGQYPVRMEAIKGYFPGDVVPYGAYFALKNAQDVVVPWVPSVGDLLATDWFVVA